jgi:hypothetical protein
MKKQWWKSRILWVNILAATSEGINLLSGQLIPPGTVAIVSNAITIVLRFLTTQPIGNPAKEAKINPPITP